MSYGFGTTRRIAAAKKEEMLPKRGRQVFPNDMVTHVWAQQTQAAGRSHNGNVSFSGPVLYSYSTPIANIVRGRGGIRVALCDSASYSPTTSQHQSNARSSFGYGDSRIMPVFEVPYIGARGGRSISGDKPDHAENRNYLVAQYQKALESWRRTALESWRETAAENHVAECAQTIRDYCEAFGLKAPTIDLAADCAAVKAHRAARMVRENDPATVAKRERARAQRAERHLRKLAEAIAKWRRGETTYFPHELRRQFPDALLRIRGDNLETSQGASVPLDHAIKAFRFIKLVRERGEPWHRNGRTIRVGHFQVDSIDASGNIRAGCHRIDWPEIEQAAKLIGVFDSAPSAEAEEHRAQ